MKLPELLSPAGDLERVQTALLYGADAVYLAGRLFGMRAKSVSFPDTELEQAIRLIHNCGKKAYITCNVLPREEELVQVPDYFAFLQEQEADALILADLGLLRMAERYAPKCARHVSTQLGVLNSETASFLYDLGADTVVLARECSLNEIRGIRAHCPEDFASKPLYTARCASPSPAVVCCPTIWRGGTLTTGNARSPAAGSTTWSRKPAPGSIWRSPRATARIS